MSGVDASGTSAKVVGIEIDASHARGLQVGDGNIQHNYFAGRREISWPHRVGVVPALADCRQPRPADQALATAVAAGATTAVVCQVVAGLGGVGKTQVAANLVHSMWQDRQVHLLVWVAATSRTSIVSTYAQTAADVTGVDDPDPDQAAARFLAWLAGTHRPWLIVLDDLTDPDDLTGLWPPDTCPHGRTIVTSRRRDAALTAGRHIIDVELFAPAEAAAYLTAKLAGAAQLNDDPDGLAADLGHLPLALAQAAAYLLDRHLTCTEYRRRFAAKQLRQLTPLSLPDQHRMIIAATWQVSIDLADQLTPPGIARHLLRLAALVDANGIPADLFTTSAVVSLCTARGEGDIDGHDIDDALQVLHQLSLAVVDRVHGTVRVHALVQRAVREATDPAEVATLAGVAATGLLDLWPEVERDTTVVQTLRSNATLLYRHTGNALLGTDVHPVLFRLEESLGESGLLNVAIALLEQLLADGLGVLGPDHPDTLNIRHNLARWRADAGDPAGAVTDLERLIPDCLRVLGPEHPGTLTTRSSLARRRGEAGDVAGAVTGLEQLIPDYLRVLGPDHPNVFAARNNLAYWRGEAGDVAGAAAAFEQLLADKLRVFGPDHRETLGARLNLAGWKGMAGDPADAAAGFEQLVPDYVRLLGPDHPDTLVARNNLAYWRGHAGDPAGAAAAFEELLTDRLRVLGPDHPHIHATRSSIAHWHSEAATS